MSSDDCDYDDDGEFDDGGTPISGENFDDRGDDDFEEMEEDVSDVSPRSHPQQPNPVVEITWQTETSEPPTPVAFRPRTVVAEPQGEGGDPGDDLLENNVTDMQITVYESGPPPTRAQSEALRRQDVVSRECRAISHRIAMRSQQRDRAVSRGTVMSGLDPADRSALISRGTTLPPSSMGQRRPHTMMSMRGIATPSIGQRYRTLADDRSEHRNASKFVVERVMFERLKQSDVNPYASSTRCLHKLMDDGVIRSQDYGKVSRSLNTITKPFYLMESYNHGYRSLDITPPQHVEPLGEPGDAAWGYGTQSYDGVFSRRDVLQLQRIFEPYTAAQTTDVGRSKTSMSDRRQVGPVRLPQPKSNRREEVEKQRRVALGNVKSNDSKFTTTFANGRPLKGGGSVNNSNAQKKGSALEAMLKERVTPSAVLPKLRVSRIVQEKGRSCMQ
eukprot:PhM_4_TR5370/c0_g1_i1/m.85450